MSSTNKTENYLLNQWIGSDPVLREDFNADNLAVDTNLKAVSDVADNALALAQSASAEAGGNSAAVAQRPYVTIFDITLPADTIQYDIDVSDIDFTQYSSLDLLISFIPNGQVSCYLRVALNNVKTGYRNYDGYLTDSYSTAGTLADLLDYTGGYYDHSVMLRFFPPETGKYVSCEYVQFTSNHPNQRTSFSETVKWEDLASINIYNGVAPNGQPMKAGARYIMTGLLKPQAE